MEGNNITPDLGEVSGLYEQRNGWFQAFRSCMCLPAAAVIVANSELPNHLTQQVMLLAYLHWWPSGYTVLSIKNSGSAKWPQGLRCCFYFYLALKARPFSLALPLFCAWLIAKPVTSSGRAPADVQYSVNTVGLAFSLCWCQTKMLSRHLKPLTLKVSIDLESLLGIQTQRPQCPLAYLPPCLLLLN